MEPAAVTVRNRSRSSEVTDRCVRCGASTPAAGTPPSLSRPLRRGLINGCGPQSFSSGLNSVRGWRSLIGLSLLIALVAALVLAGFAGAQRTRTAVDRMIDATEASDVNVNPEDGDESALNFDDVAALPMVAEFSRVHGVSASDPGPYESVEDLFIGPMVVSHDGSLLRDFDRPVLVDGQRSRRRFARQHLSGPDLRRLGGIGRR